MKLSIVVVSYNTAKLTLQTLESVWQDLKSDRKLLAASEVWVVDNHSGDGSVTQIKKWRQRHRGLRLHLLANQKNLGFAAANNQAIRRSRGELILLLNSDTIVKPGALASLVSRFTPINNLTANLASHHQEIDRVGIAAAHLLNADGSYQPQGGDFPSLWRLWVQMNFWDDLPFIGGFFASAQHTGLNHRSQQQKSLEIKDWVGGTAMMLRRQMLDEIGLLDENIFMYGEDIELCLRAKKHLWDVVIDHRAKIVHLGSQSGGRETAIHGELLNYLYLWRKHYPHWQRPWLKLIIKWGVFWRIILFTILSRPDRRRIYQRLWSKL